MEANKLPSICTSPWRSRKLESDSLSRLCRVVISCLPALRRLSRWLSISRRKLSSRCPLTTARFSISSCCFDEPQGLQVGIYNPRLIICNGEFRRGRWNSEGDYERLVKASQEIVFWGLVAVASYPEQFRIPSARHRLVI